VYSLNRPDLSLNYCKSPMKSFLLYPLFRCDLLDLLKACATFSPNHFMAFERISIL